MGYPLPVNTFAKMQQTNYPRHPLVAELTYLGQCSKFRTRISCGLFHSLTYPANPASLAL